MYGKYYYYFHYLLAQEIDFFSRVEWQVLIVDEAHRLKNEKSVLYGNLMDLKCPSKIMLTGTPIIISLMEK
jgi:chromodomain-helicase-DNA-binding protein 1